MSKKVIVASGKRKSAVAKATLKEGVGKIRINNVPLDIMQPFLYRERIRESLLLAEDLASKVDIDVTCKGGGAMSQSDAARLAIAKAMVEYAPKMKATYLNYDRKLIVADVRLKETHKPNRHGGARAKKQKSYR